MLCLYLLTELEDRGFSVRYPNACKQEEWKKTSLKTLESLWVPVTEKHFRDENMASQGISRFY